MLQMFSDLPAAAILRGHQTTVEKMDTSTLPKQAPAAFSTGAKWVNTFFCHTCLELKFLSGPFNHLYTGNPLMGTFANSEDPDEIRVRTGLKST